MTFRRSHVEFHVLPLVNVARAIGIDFATFVMKFLVDANVHEDCQLSFPKLR